MAARDDQYLGRDALAAAAEVCTEKQMQVLRMRNDGLGVRTIARKLEISTSAARERLDAADRKVGQAILEKRAEA